MKEIKISGEKGKGKVALVDDEDFELLNRHSWCLGSSGEALRSSTAKSRKRVPIRMHRVIIHAPKNVDVDHINGNPLDNRRRNLRLCNKIENNYNRKLRTDNTSGFKGVYPHKSKWRAEVGYNHQNIYLGTYTNKLEAKHVYNSVALQLHKEFAKL